MTQKKRYLILIGCIAAFVAIVTAIGYYKFKIFALNGLDVAIYRQVFWNTVHGRPFAFSIHPPSYLGDHAEWLILALAPFYALVPSPVTLVFLQAVALGISAWPIYLIVQNLSKRNIRHQVSDVSLQTPGFASSPSLLAMTMSLLWLANPYVWNVALYEFHMLPFAIPILFFAAYFYTEKRFIPFLICIGSALLVREDVPLAVAGFSLLALVDRRWKLKWIAVPLALAAFVFVVDQKLIAHFNPDASYKYLAYYAWLGRSFPELVRNAILHPLKVLVHISTFTTVEFLIGAALPFVFLIYIRPRWLIVGSLVYLQLLLTDTGTTSVIFMTQYISLLLPPLVLSSIEGFAALDSMQRFKTIRPVMPVIIAAAALYASVALGPIQNELPISGTLPPAHVAALNEALARIPADASVAASFAPMVNLAERQHLYSFHYQWLGRRQFGTAAYTSDTPPDYLLIDLDDFVSYAAIFPSIDWTADAYPTGDDRFRALIAQDHYGIVFRRGSVVLMKKDSPSEQYLYRRYDSMDAAKKEIAHPASTSLGPLTFVGWSRLLSEQGGGWRLFFRTDKKITADAVMKVNGQYDPFGAGIYPTREWVPGEVVELPLFSTDDTLRMTLENVSGFFAIDHLRATVLHIENEKPIGPSFSLR
jgi:uncharacterized membrane protein